MDDEPFDRVRSIMDDDKPSEIVLLDCLWTDARIKDILLNVLPIHFSRVASFGRTRLVCKQWSKAAVNHTGILNCEHEGGRDKFYLVNSPVKPNLSQTQLLASTTSVRLDESSITWFSHLYKPKAMPHLGSITVNTGNYAITPTIVTGLTLLFQKQQEANLVVPPKSARTLAWELYLCPCKESDFQYYYNRNDLHAVDAVLMWMDSGVCFRSLSMALYDACIMSLPKVFQHRWLKHATLMVYATDVITDDVARFMQRHSIHNPDSIKQEPLIPIESLTLHSQGMIYPYFMMAQFLLSYLVMPKELAFVGPGIENCRYQHLPYAIDTLHLVNPKRSINPLSANWVRNFLTREIGPVRKLVLVRPNFELRHIIANLGDSSKLKELEFVHPETCIRETDVRSMRQALHEAPNLEHISFQGVSSLGDVSSTKPVKHFVRQMKGPSGVRPVASKEAPIIDPPQKVRRRIVCQRNEVFQDGVEFVQNNEKLPEWRWRLNAPSTDEFC